MGFYDKHILPRFINCACGAKPIMKQREKVVPLASDTVLVTYALCTIPDPVAALQDMARVLRPGAFSVGELATLYLPGTPRFAGYNFRGWAQQA